MTTSSHSPGTNQESAVAVKLVKCPNCAGDSVYASSNPYRPFCSAYCKNSDFVAWANEDFRVPEKPSTDLKE
jgi:endogenous inhibitor of DNA gyrase (YacG/DUF329 family)